MNQLVVLSDSNCCFLIWIQVSQEGGKVFWCSYFYKNFSQFVGMHTVKVFSIFSEAEIDVFSGILPCLPPLFDPVGVANLISGSPAFCKSSLYIWKFSVHILLKPSLKDFEHYLTSMWNECNCVVIWTTTAAQRLSGGYVVLEWWLHGAGVTLRRYPRSKGKGEAPARW